MKRRGTVRVGLVVLGLITAVGAVWLLCSGGVGLEEQTPGLSAKPSAAVAAAKAQSRLAAVETAAHQSLAPDTSDRTDPTDPTDQARRTPAAARPAPAALPTLATPTRAGPPPRDESQADLGKVQDRYANCEVLDERTSPVNAAGQYERVRIVKTSMKYPLVRVEERFQVSGVRDQEAGGRGQEAGRRGQGAEFPEPQHMTPSSSPLKPDTRHLTPQSDTLLSQSAMVANHVTVQVKEGTTEAQLAAYAQAKGGKILRKLRVPGPGTYLVKMAEAKVDTVPQAVTSLKQTGAPVEIVTPDRIAYATETAPNDPRFGELWGMRNATAVVSGGKLEAGGKVLVAFAIQYSGVTPSEGIAGCLYPCGLGKVGEFPAGVSGNIALIRRGDITFAEKATNAKAAGARAVIVYNNVAGAFSGTMGAAGDWLPTASMSDADGMWLASLGNIPCQLTMVLTRADIAATKAWDQTTGSRNILVGIIDTGVDYNHPDLAANMWTNSGETGTDANGADKRTNGLDDDGNGFVDDWHGWDFYNDDNDSMDDHFHGTHCAGTIGGVGNNGIGVAGVSWNVSLVGLKFLNAAGEGSLSDGMEATYYATKIGAKLTSNSWGGGAGPEYKSDPTDLMRQAILDAGAHGILFVAAAGNSRSDNDGTKVAYPSSYDCDNIIAVAATDSMDELASFSCYGATTVDLGAPGVGILSCKPDNSYQFLQGTSMATPHVAGACALLASQVPDWNAAQLKARLLERTDPIGAMAGMCVTGGRLNIGRAVFPLQPSLLVQGVSVDDAAGNADGIINPGETVALTASLFNDALAPVAGVGATLSCTDAYVTVVDHTAAFGDFAGTQTKAALDPFAIAISPVCPTPHELTFNVGIVAATGGVWTGRFKLMVNNSSQISGQATLDGGPAAGVTIAFAGPVSGTRVTDAAGRYMFGAIDGSYTLIARKDGWLESLPLTVAVPPVRTNVNFAFTTAIVSGRVTDVLTGAVMAGATVEYGTNLTGLMLTDSDGQYSFSRVYGRSATLTVTAKATNYFDTVKTVTVPPNAIVDFAMGYSDIDVAPLSFDVTAVMGQTVTQSLTLQNLGASDLSWSINPGGKVLRKLSKPAYGHLAFDGSALWFLREGTYPGILDKYDAATGAKLGELRVTLPTVDAARVGHGLTWDGANLLMAELIAKNNGSSGSVYTAWLHVVDPTTGRIGKTFTWGPVDGAWHVITGVAAGDGAIWIRGWRDETTIVICKLDAVTGAELSSWVLPRSTVSSYAYSGLEYANGAIWLPGWEGDDVYYSIYKLDAATGQVITRFPCTLGLKNGGQDTALLYDLAMVGSRTMWVCGGSESWLVDMGDDPWMKEAPQTGTVPGLGNQTLTLTLDTTATGPGVQNSTYRIVSNDPDEPEVLVPVKFTVLANPANHAPVIAEGTNVNVIMSEDGQPTPFSLTLRAMDADHDPLVWRVASVAAHGTVAANGTGTNLPVFYMPALHYSGTDSFTVEVADGKGGVGAIVVNVTIQNVNVAPTVTLTASPMMIGTAPLPVAFTVAAADADGDALRYEWNFGDGSTSVSQAAGTTNHTYLAAGTYQAAVTVSDPDGLSAQAALTITVWSNAPAWGIPFAWGHNERGGPLNGTTNLLGAVQLPGLTGIRSVSGGPRHSVALKSDGTVYGFGANDCGQLGDGTLLPHATPEQITGLVGAVGVNIAFSVNSVVAKADGTVWGCGNSQYGQLGDGTRSNRTIPVQARLVDNTPLSNVTAVAAGFFHTLAVKRDSTVVAWGYNWTGALGDGTPAYTMPSPWCRVNPVQTIMPGGKPLSNVVAVAAGYLHSMALKSDGTVWTWGLNDDRALGTGLGDSAYPVQVAGLANITAISAGLTHSLALQNDGRVWAWGKNVHGQCGDGTSGTGVNSVKARPVLALISNVVEISGGAYHSMARKSDGTVWAWGRNNDGQLGDGTTEDQARPVQTKFADGRPVSGSTSIAATWYGGFAVTSGLVTNQPPVANPQGVTTLANTARGITLTGSDPEGVGLSYTVLISPAHGTLSGTAPGVIYMPATNYSGSDSFTFKVNDGALDSTPATVTITVTELPTYAVPDAPTGFVATTAATNQINLAWSDQATNETGYVVDRSLDSTNWTFVTLTAVNATNTTSTGLTTNTLYYYRVAASNAAGLSSYCYATGSTWTVYEQWRHQSFDQTCLTNPAISGATADPDHDGLNNEQEFWAGTSPTNASSCLVLYALTNNPAALGEYVVRWQSVSGRLYTVQAATNLVVGFTNLVTHRPATPPLNVHTDNVGSAGQRFYRVQVE